LDLILKGELLMQKIAFAIGCLFLSTTAFAGTSDIKASNNQISIQTISTNVDYTETYDGAIVDTETGDVPGYAVSMSTMTGDNNRYLEAEYEHTNGTTNYVGGLVGPPATPYGSVIDTTGATLTNYSGRLGRGIVIDKTELNSDLLLMLTPNAELGHHKWDRGVNYGETYTNDYFALGLLYQTSAVNSKLVVSANAMLGSTFRSKIVVNSGAGLTGFSGALGNSTFYKIGFSADYPISEHFHGNVGADYTSFHYGMSGGIPVGGGLVAIEPSSNTIYTTIKLGLGFSF
jgi:hypothetical protein